MKLYKSCVINKATSQKGSRAKLLLWIGCGGRLFMQVTTIPAHSKALELKSPRHAFKQVRAVWLVLKHLAMGLICLGKVDVLPQQHTSKS